MMFRSLDYRNFRLFFAGQFVSLIGGWLQHTAQAWLVYRLTKDSMMLGLVAFVSQFPAFLLGFYAGFVVDRGDHLKIVRRTQAAAMLQAVILAALCFSGWVQVWHVFVLALALGIVTAFDLPARQVLIGELVEPEHRHNAIALNSTIVNGSRIVGPALAGLMIGWVGEAWCFALNALSFLAVIGALYAMKEVRQAPSTMKDALWEEVGKGLSYAAGHEAIRASLLTLGIFSLLGLPLFVLLPVFAEEVLHAGPKGFGILSSFSGIGATFGALHLARRSGTAGLGKIIVESFLIFSVAVLGLACSRQLWLSCSLMWVIGFAGLQTVSGINTVLQDLVGDRYRGRVMGFFAMVFVGLAPIGSFAAGSLASRFGAPATVALEALLCLGFTLWHFRTLPRLLVERPAGLLAGPEVPAPL